MKQPKYLLISDSQEVFFFETLEEVRNWIIDIEFNENEMKKVRVFEVKREISNEELELKPKHTKVDEMMSTTSQTRERTILLTDSIQTKFFNGGAIPAEIINQIESITDRTKQRNLLKQILTINDSDLDKISRLNQYLAHYTKSDFEKKRAGRNIKVNVSDELPEGVTEEEYKILEELAEADWTDQKTIEKNAEKRDMKLAVEKVIKEVRIETAEGLIKYGYEDGQISRISKLPIEEVKKLRQGKKEEMISEEEYKILEEKAESGENRYYELASETMKDLWDNEKDDVYNSEKKPEKNNKESKGMKFKNCLCCGQPTLRTEKHDICDNCWWQDDPSAWHDIDYVTPGNGISLREGRVNYEKSGNCDGIEEGK